MWWKNGTATSFDNASHLMAYSLLFANDLNDGNGRNDGKSILSDSVKSGHALRNMTGGVCKGRNIYTSFKIYCNFECAMSS